MTVGEVAKKMNTTVRTLQYYDRKGLLLPSSESVGGRRLYTDKDVILLHQILSLKSLGFSLGDIKHRLITLDSPADVAAMLAEQAVTIREKVESLSESLRAIEALLVEVLQMQSVNFKKYADIIASLQRKNEMYWAIKHFDDEFLDHVRDRLSDEGGLGITGTFERLQDEAIRLEAAGVLPESEQGQAFGRVFWDMITTFTGGDMTLLPKLIALDENMDGWDKTWKERYEQAKGFIESALDAYFTSLGQNPFEEATQP